MDATLKMAGDLIAEVQRLWSRQRHHVAEMARLGADTTEARKLGSELEQLLTQLQTHGEQLLREKGRGDLRPVGSAAY